MLLLMPHDRDLAARALVVHSHLHVHSTLPTLPLPLAPYNSDQMHKINATITCEVPNRKLYDFNGSIQGKGPDSKNLDQGITINNILLRGTIVRNTDRVYAVVVYTGHDTRLMQNCVDPPSKRSLLDQKVDTSLYLM